MEERRRRLGTFAAAAAAEEAVRREPQQREGTDDPGHLRVVEPGDAEREAEDGDVGRSVGGVWSACFLSKVEGG